MGVVYEAEQESLGRRVALKVLPRANMLTDPKQVRRFEREAKAAAGCITPISCRSSASASKTVTHFYVMQFIQGQGLDAVLDELQRLAGRARPAGEALRPAVSRISGQTAADIARSLVTGRFAAGRADGDARHRQRHIRRGSGPPGTVPAAGSVAFPARSLPGTFRPVGVGVVPGDRPPVLPQRGADRRPGGRGAGLRPWPGHPAPRYQAVESACWTGTATSG